MVFAIRNEVPHASDIDDGAGRARPAGVRHEIVVDPADSAFVLVHLVINTTEAERRFFSEARTTWPDTDWDNVPR